VQLRKQLKAAAAAEGFGEKDCSSKEARSASHTPWLGLRGRCGRYSTIAGTQQVGGRDDTPDRVGSSEPGLLRPSMQWCPSSHLDLQAYRTARVQAHLPAAHECHTVFGWIGVWQPKKQTPLKPSKMRRTAPVVLTRPCTRPLDAAGLAVAEAALVEAVKG
jgi:hypothetical protein